MWRFTAVALLTLTCASCAWACQPPQDQPHDQLEAQRYWEAKRLAIVKHIFSSAKSVLVAKVSAQKYPEWTEPSMSSRSTVALSGIKLLRGAPLTSHTGVIESSMCADYRPGINEPGLHLLAMEGQMILAALPLVAAQQKSDIASFFKKIDEPNPIE